MCGSSGGSPSASRTRSFISDAALSVKVTARMFLGSRPGTFWSRQTIRCVMTRVLPLPGPAIISSGPSPCSTALFCSGLSLRLEFTDSLFRERAQVSKLLRMKGARRAPGCPRGRQDVWRSRTLLDLAMLRLEAYNRPVMQEEPCVKQ